jgi:SSS family solute:Na+ symporter
MGFASANESGVYEIPFLDRMGFVFILCVIIMYFISMFDNRNGVTPHGLEVDTKMFKPNNAFAVGALIICGLLVALYSFFW